jgi:phospholipase C
LLSHNPNSLHTAVNGAGAINPFRLDRSEAATADQDNAYTPEQKAFHGGMMDAFPEYTGIPGLTPSGKKTKGLVMGYYDGNTVTALWNYAQKYALNDNNYGTTFGPSLVGAINLISGQTDGVTDKINAGSNVVEDGGGGYSLLGDGDPIGDVCSTTTGTQFQFSGQNIFVEDNWLDGERIGNGSFDSVAPSTICSTSLTTGAQPWSSTKPPANL